MEGFHKATRRELIDLAVVEHYRKNLAQTGDRRLAAKLVVLDIIEGAEVPLERERAHAQIVSDILTKYEEDSFTELMADVEAEHDGNN